MKKIVIVALMSMMFFACTKDEEVIIELPQLGNDIRVVARNGFRVGALIEMSIEILNYPESQVDIKWDFNDVLDVDDYGRLTYKDTAHRFSAIGDYYVPVLVSNETGTVRRAVVITITDDGSPDSGGAVVVDKDPGHIIIIEPNPDTGGDISPNKKNYISFSVSDTSQFKPPISITIAGRTGTVREASSYTPDCGEVSDRAWTFPIGINKRYDYTIRDATNKEVRHRWCRPQSECTQVRL